MLPPVHAACSDTGKDIMDTLPPIHAVRPRKEKERSAGQTATSTCGLPTGGDGGRKWDMRHLYMRMPSPEEEALAESPPIHATRQLGGKKTPARTP